VGAISNRDLPFVPTRKPVAVENRSHPQRRPSVGAISIRDLPFVPTRKPVAVENRSLQ
jgi:hypothetical protein